MDMKRRAARGVAVLAVALAAGHLVQSMGKTPVPKQVASAALTQEPIRVETVAAGPKAAAPVRPMPKVVMPETVVTADAGSAISSHG